MAVTDRSPTTSPKNSRQANRITITEAVTKFRMSSSAIRRLIGKGVLKTSEDEKRRILIDEEELHGYLATSDPKTLSANKNKIAGASAKTSIGSSTSTSELTIELYGEMLKREKELNAQLQKSLEDQKRELQEERKRNLELQTELMTMTKEMKAIINNESGVLRTLFGTLKRDKK
ncbi:MAG: hypothetical protein K2X69_09270 [Silvanigrellaceae bacterium]|nr:hypothetical protein [Silvanigrellaceae bacterium]